MSQNDLEVLDDLGPAPAHSAWAPHRRAVVSLGQPDRELRTLVLKLGADDAHRLADRLASLTSLSMAPSETGVIVRGWAGARDLGPLTVLPAVDPFIDALVVSRGGARRSQLWAHEVISLHATTVRVPQGRGNAVAGWPEASATLLRFVSPLRPGEMPQPMAAEVIRMASTVWSGVVLADHEGDTDLLEEARAAVCERGAPEALVDLLIDRKRRRFGGDPRMIAVDNVAMEDDDLRVTVQATVPRSR